MMRCLEGKEFHTKWTKYITFFFVPFVTFVSLCEMRKIENKNVVQSTTLLKLKNDQMPVTKK